MLGGGGIGGERRTARGTAVTPTARVTRMRWHPGVLAWALWVSAVLSLAAAVWMDHLLRRPGRPDLAVVEVAAMAVPAVHLGVATVGVVVASRRPRHPVGWLLLAIGLVPNASMPVLAYANYGLAARPGGLPGARWAALYLPAFAVTALALLGVVLLLTPTGSLPSRRWRWWIGSAAAALVGLLLAVAVAPTPSPGPTRHSRPPSTCTASRARCRSPTRRVSPSPSRAWWWASSPCCCGSAAPVAPNASSHLGGRGRVPARPPPHSAAVDRRFNRRRYDAAQTVQTFSDRLRQQVDLDTVTVELLAKVDRTVQPTRALLWLRPPRVASRAANHAVAGRGT
jgi:hypothetical protein